MRFHLNEEYRDHRILLFFLARDARFRSIVNVIMTVVAVLLLDRLGRKPLLYIGIAGMIATLVVLGAAFLRPEAQREGRWPCSV